MEMRHPQAAYGHHMLGPSAAADGVVVGMDRERQGKSHNHAVAVGRNASVAAGRRDGCVGRAVVVRHAMVVRMASPPVHRRKRQARCGATATVAYPLAASPCHRRAASSVQAGGVDAAAAVAHRVPADQPVVVARPANAVAAAAVGNRVHDETESVAEAAAWVCACAVNKFDKCIQ